MCTVKCSSRELFTQKIVRELTRRLDHRCFINAHASFFYAKYSMSRSLRCPEESLRFRSQTKTKGHDLKLKLAMSGYAWQKTNICDAQFSVIMWKEKSLLLVNTVNFQLIFSEAWYVEEVVQRFKCWKNGQCVFIYIAYSRTSAQKRVTLPRKARSKPACLCARLGRAASGNWVFRDVALIMCAFREHTGKLDIFTFFWRRKKTLCDVVERSCLPTNRWRAQLRFRVSSPSGVVALCFLPSMAAPMNFPPVSDARKLIPAT